MKHRIKHFSKATLSTVLALCMLLSCLSVGLIATDAAKVYDEGLGGAGSTTGNWHLFNSVRGQWNNTVTNATDALQLSRGNNGNDYYTLFYFKPNDGDIYWRYWSVDNNNTLGARSSDANVSGGNDNAHHNGVWGWWNSWKFATSDLGSDNSKFYKVWIHLNPAGGDCGNSGNDYYAGWTWVTSEEMSDYSATVTTKKGNTNTTTFTLGDTVTLSGSTSNGIGTASYAYKYKKSNDSSWTNVSGSTFIPSTAGTYIVKVTATDGGVITSGNNKNAISSRTATSSEVEITVNKPTFNITVSAKTDGSVSTTGGTVSPTSISGINEDDERTITASPKTDQNYFFSGWTCANNKVTFVDVNALETTFTATGADTIYGNFVQDTVYNVTVNNGRNASGNPATTTVVESGSLVNPELTAAAPADDEYSFTGWTLSGNVQLVNGYNLDDTTIKIKSTGSGNTGTVTANYAKVDYIYFYAALQSNWNSNPVVTVDGEEVGAYKWLASYAAGDTAKNLYSNSSGTQIGGNNCYSYYIGVFRVPVDKAGKNISVFNSKQTGTNTNKGYIGALTNDQGRCYYTYSTASDNNHSGSIAPQKVNSVTCNFSTYDADDTVTVSKTETTYYGTKTAGQDTFTYTYTAQNTSTNAVYTLGADLASSTGTFTFVPNQKGISTSGTYNIIITTKDSKTGRILNSCSTQNAITIDAVPSESTVTFSQTLTGATDSFTGKYTYKNTQNQSFSSGASLRAGSQVTLTLVLKSGYTRGTTTAKFGTANLTKSESYNSTTRTLTITFTVPSGGSAITVSHAATEVTHSITIKRRFYNYNGSSLLSQDSSAYRTISGAGVATAVSTGDAPTETNYTFKKFTLPSPEVTKASGDENTQAAITVNATADGKTIYLDYWETVYNITVKNTDGHGLVKRGSTTVASAGGTGTTQIGYVTAVSLTATPNIGYDFKEWVITAGTATKVKVNGGAEQNLPLTVSESDPSIATSSFQFNGTATVTAKFQAVNYSISASLASNAYTTDPTTGNYVTVSRGSGNIGDTFNINVVLADGYEVASITGAGISSTMPTPSVSGRTNSYQYTLGDSNVVATITLKAKTPTLSNVQVRDNSTSSFPFVTITTNTNNPKNTYYLQDTVVKATTDSFPHSSLTFTTKTTSGTQISTASGVASNTETTLAASSSVIPTTENGYAEYRLYVTAINAPDGVDAVPTEFSYGTIRVYFNNAQKSYFKLNNLFSRCVRENASNNPYYKQGAPINTYNEEYDDASDFIDEGYPAYDADADDATEAQNIYTEFKTQYDAMKDYANTTTVYILANSSYTNTATKKVNVYASGSGDGYNHFRMFSYGEEIPGANEHNYHTTYYGKVKKNNTDYYIYTFTYRGHANVQVWVGNNASDTTFVPSTNTAKRLTGTISKASATDFDDYYINVYDKTASSSNNSTTWSAYNDFGHTKNNGKKDVELNEAKTRTEIFNLFNFQSAGSIVSNPGITVSSGTSFTIEGPIGKSTSKTYDLINGTNLDENNKFPASEQGRYTVRYTSQFGTYADGTTISRTETASLWVADEINVYVDMNENIGIPILNFEYHVDSSGNPAASGTVAYLPFEMDLVTGSESIYKYTLKISNLRDVYKINLTHGEAIHISYITVENNKIGSGTGFDINTEALFTGEAWLKADSTNLKTFIPISCGSVNKSFVAINESGNTVLSSAIDGVHGTGIITDEDDIYNDQYASIYTYLDNNEPPQAQTIANFNYVVKARANEEVKISGNTYYFDKWIAVPSDCFFFFTNENTQTVTYSHQTDYSDSADSNFTSAVDYNNGEADVTYIALYKMVSSGDSTVRVEIIYNFEDYNTADGNYIYDENKDTVSAHYTKTVKVPLNTTYAPTGVTYADQAAVEAAVDAIARTNAPYVASNYFKYSYVTGSADVQTYENSAAESKIVVTASLHEEARTYRIVVLDADNNDTVVGTPTTGKYQNTEVLTTNKSNPVWTDSEGNVLATGATYNARYVSSGNETHQTYGDCQIIKVKTQSGVSTDHTSVVSNSFTEVYYDGSTEKLRHNFYIIDYCAEGKLVGGGVLYATGSYSGNNWSYRQDSATTNLADSTTRAEFIRGIINPIDPSDPQQNRRLDYFGVEYKAQTINNIGFRYKPFKSTEDVFRYSDDLRAYLTMFEGSNVNSANYESQKLRLFSFMVYDDNGTSVIVPSEGYAEVSRYQPQPQS